VHDNINRQQHTTTTSAGTQATDFAELGGKDFLDAGLQAAKLGWRIFPCNGRKEPLVKWKQAATIDEATIIADSDDLARGARRSGCFVSGIGEAAWSILNRGSTGLFFCCCCSAVGMWATHFALSKRSGMSTAPRAQAFRPGLRVRRMLSPLRSIRWALWTRRSRTASA